MTNCNDALFMLFENGFGFVFLTFHSWLFVLEFSTHPACLLCNFQMRISEMLGGLLDLGLLFFLIQIRDTLVIFDFPCIWTSDLSRCIVANVLRKILPLYDDLRETVFLHVCVSVGYSWRSVTSHINLILVQVYLLSLFL